MRRPRSMVSDLAQGAKVGVELPSGESSKAVLITALPNVPFGPLVLNETGDLIGSVDAGGLVHHIGDGNPADRSEVSPSRR